MPNPRPLNFEILRDQIRPIDVLRLSGWAYRYHCGEVFRGGCPIHRSTSRTSRSFVCNSRVWYCHKCKLGGDAVRLAAKLWNCGDLDAAYRLCAALTISPPYR